jgi:Yeast PIR protein repeat
MNPAGVPNPTQKAINVTAHATAVPASQISDGQVQNSKDRKTLNLSTLFLGCSIDVLHTVGVILVQWHHIQPFAGGSCSRSSQ